jgi:hypothetical protein
MMASIFIELPCNIGETVWVSPNNGKSFHSAILLGVKANRHNTKHLSFIVEVNDNARDFVKHPLSRSFVDYFGQVFTREQMEENLGRQNDG